MHRNEATDTVNDVNNMDTGSVERTVTLTGYEADRISDISLHLDDLTFGLQCLEEMENISPEREVSKNALWRCAVIHFLKCFNSTAKFKLSPETIFYNDAVKNDENFLFFKSLFSKYLLHDEKSFKQYKTNVILKDNGESLAVGKIQSYAVSEHRFTEKNFKNLKHLIQTTKDWVEVEREILLKTMTIRIEKEPRERFAQRVLQNHDSENFSFL